MRILLISAYFPPQPAVASLRAHDFARTWSDAGEQVTVLSTSKRDDQRGWPIESRRFALVELPYRVPRWLEAVRRRSLAPHSGDEGKASGRVRAAMRRAQQRLGVFASLRKPDLTDHWVAPAIKWASAHGPWDVVVSSSGPYTAHLVALALKRRGHAATWAADFRDLWVQNHVARGLFPFTVIERAAQRRCLRAVDLVTTVSAELASCLRRRTAAPVAVIYNGFDPGEISRLDPAPALPADGRARLVYTGTTYASGQDPSILLSGLAQLRARSPQAAERLAAMVVVGRGGETWRRPARALGVEDLLDIRGVVGRDESLRLQRDCSALVLLDWKDPQRGVLTGKVFEYLAADSPIIVAGGGSGSPAGALVERTGRGVHCVSPEQVADALTAVLLGTTPLCPSPDRAAIGSFSRREQSLAFLSRLHSMRGRTAASGAPAAPRPLAYDQPA